MGFVIAASLTACLLAAESVFAPLPPDTETIEVAESDGSLQCEQNSGTPLQKMQQTLTDKELEVFSSRRGHDCLMRTQVCGQTTGALNIYRIKKNDLEAAKELGFQPLTSCQ